MKRFPAATAALRRRLGARVVRTEEAELTEALRGWHLQVERFASRTDPHATIFRLSDIRHASPEA